MLAAVQDSRFIVWYHPSVIYSDRDLLPLTQFSKEDRLVRALTPGVVWRGYQLVRRLPLAQLGRRGYP